MSPNEDILPTDTDLDGPTEGGPSIEEAKALLATVVHTPLPEAAGLPTDVRDGEAGDGS